MNNKLCYDIINKQIIDETILAAKNCERKRKNYNFHELDNNVQRMLNAIEPESYIRPHRHSNPPKIESFIVLKGSVTVIIYDQKGGIIDCILLEANSENYGIDIKPGVWHSLISNKTGSVVFEVKDGPYNPATDKDFAEWSPKEGDENVDGFLEKIRGQAKDFFNSMFHVKH